MPKQVQGFLTEDDTFFEKQEDAEIYESEVLLRQACNKLEIAPGITIDDDKVIHVLDNLEEEVLRYLNARQRAKQHTAVELRPEDELDSVLEQPPRGDEPVPYVRRRKRAANV